MSFFEFLPVIPENWLSIGWIIYPVLYFIVALFSTYVILRLMLGKLKVSREQKWFEQAREVYPLKHFISFSRIVLLILAVSVSIPFTNEIFYPISTFFFAAFCGVGAYTGASLAAYLLKNKIPGPKSSNWLALRNNLSILTNFILLYWVVFSSIGLFSEYPYGHLIGAIVSFLLLAVVAFAGSIFLCMKLFGLIAPATPILKEAIVEASKKMDFKPAPRSFVLRSSVVNAFAYHAGRAVGFTTKALEVLEYNEIVAICTHEIAHLRERRRDKLMRFLPLLLFFIFLGFMPYIDNYIHPIIVIVILLPLALFINRILTFKISEKFEKSADKEAKLAMQQQEDKKLYARALEKLYMHNLIPVVMPGKHKTHPNLYDRMESAGVTPDYPRPKAPRRTGYILANISVLFLNGLFAAILLLIHFKSVHFMYHPL